MSSPKRVRTRDNRVVPFDDQRIVSAITEAMVEAGTGGVAAARELTSAVLHFLELEADPEDEAVPVDTIHNMVEKVLMETGHREVARAYVLRRDRNRRLRERLDPPRSRAVGPADDVDDPERLLRVGSDFDASESTWSRSRIAAALIKEADMDADAAEEIAAAVEARVHRSGRERISTRIIRELVDNELFDRGYTVSLDRQASVSLPRFDLERLLFGGGDPTRGLFAGHPGQIMQSIGQNILREYLLGRVLGPEVREAFADGVLHLHELEVPLQFLRAEIPLARPARRRPLRATEEEDVFARLERRVASHFPLVAEEIQVFGLERALADERRAFAESGRESSTTEQLATRWIDTWRSLRRVREYWPGPVASVNLVVPVVPRYARVESDGPNLFPASETFEEIALPLVETVLHALSNPIGRRVLARSAFTFEVGERTFAEHRFRDALMALLSHVPQEAAVHFVPVESDTSISDREPFSEPVGDALDWERVRGETDQLRFLGGKVTLNLPRVAWEARRADAGPGLTSLRSRALHEGLARALDLARQAIRERARFMERLAIHPDAPLSSWGHDSWGRGSGESEASVGRTEFVIGLLGLEDAVRILIGASLHDHAEARRLGLEIVESLAGNLLAGQKKGDPPIHFEESANRGSVRRFQDLDRSRFPRDWSTATPPGGEYTSGVRYSREAPVDPLESWLGVQPYRERVRFLPRLDEVVRLRTEGPEVVFAYLEELCSRAKLLPKHF